MIPRANYLASRTIETLQQKRRDNVLAGNHLTTGSAAIWTTHISAFGLFQFDFAMLTEWQVILLGPL
jgi:hypothetical protein